MRQFRDVTDAYPHIIREVLNEGTSCSPRGMKIKEICDFHFRLDSYDQPTPLQKSRKLNYRFAILEGLLNIHGSAPAEIITFFNKNMANYVNESTGEFDGAYPPRIGACIKECYERLKADPDTRQAVIPIFRTSDQKMEKSKDYPCTLTLQFLIRDGRLNMIVNMRSNDCLLGLPYDVSQFGLLGKAMAGWLGIPTGWYAHQAGSMHSYDEREEQARTVTAAHFFETEEYSEFKHPQWNLTFEQTVNEMYYFINHLYNFVNPKIAVNSRLPLEPLATYLQLLTQPKK